MEINEISSQIHANAVEKGFWDGTETFNSDQLCKRLLLIISEVTEAMEADRKNKYCKQEKAGGTYLEDRHFIKNFEENIKDTLEDELADATIRIFDLAKKMNIDLESHIKAKHRYNTTRPRMHGKKY